MRQFVPVHGRADPVRPRTHAEVVSTHVPQEGAAAGNSRSGPRSATVDGRAIDESGTLLVVVALIALLGGSGRAGIRSIRRVPAPIAPDGTTAVAPREESDAIEAELQEIIAEEHSRPRVPL